MRNFSQNCIYLVSIGFHKTFRWNVGCVSILWLPIKCPYGTFIPWTATTYVFAMRSMFLTIKYTNDVCVPEGRIMGRNHWTIVLRSVGTHCAISSINWISQNVPMERWLRFHFVATHKISLRDIKYLFKCAE